MHMVSKLSDFKSQSQNWYYSDNYMQLGSTFIGEKLKMFYIIYVEGVEK